MSNQRPTDDGGTGPRTPIPYRAVFEFSPSGVVVVDAAGGVQGTNLAAKRMLRGLVERPGLRCCDLFDCRRPGTPLADHCITDLSLAHQGPMPEVRVDLPGGAGGGGSVWLTGSAFGGADPAVVLQLRPGVVGDRRRRTEPHWMAEPRLRVFTLGRTRVESGEGPLDKAWLSHRAGQLLKYLLTHRERTVPTDELIETFWPEADRRGVTSVRQAVHTLRARLEPDRAKHSDSAFVLARAGAYELERSAVWIDADEFELSVREGLKALARDDRETAEATLERAADLYRGEFLADEPYAEWAFSERERLRGLVAQVLRALSDLRVADGDLEGATERLQRLADQEAHDLGVQRDLLGLLLRRGRHQDAVRRYELVRRRYRRAFGEDVGFDLSDVTASLGDPGSGAPPSDS